MMFGRFDLGELDEMDVLRMGRISGVSRICGGMLALAWFGWVALFVNEGCQCNSTLRPDGGESVPDTSKPRQRAQIRFISPIQNELVSGQIDIEVEVIDPDGTKSVEFIANGESIGKSTAQTPDSDPFTPHYKIQIATYYLPRGMITLTARAEDHLGEKVEQSIQVRSRERWAAAFGAGTAMQFQVRHDKHLYLRMYRSEADLGSISQPGPYDRVGSAILTTNAIGSASWLYLGVGEEFGDFLLDSKDRLFFGSKKTDSGQNRLIALGAGDPKWTQERAIVPDWEVALAEASVKGAPLARGERLWIHTLTPARANEPSASALLHLDATSGKEIWRYRGQTNERFEIVRGPYLLSDGRVLFFSRTPSAIGDGFQIRMLSTEGALLWQKNYSSWRLNDVQQNPQDQRFFVGMEKREQGEVTASLVVCILPTSGEQCWQNDLGKSWPERLVIGQKLLLTQRRPTDGSYEIVAYQISDGHEIWKQTFQSHLFIGVSHATNDAFLVFSVLIDRYKDPLEMLLERYDERGRVVWRYNHKQFVPKSWIFAAEANEALWVIVRNIEDKTERFGSRLMALDKDGHRRFLFSEEARRFLGLQFVSPDSLYISSASDRGARIHHITTENP